MQRGVEPAQKRFRADRVSNRVRSIAHGPDELIEDSAMDINGRTGVISAVFCSLLLGSAFAIGADDDAAKAAKEAAKQRYEQAKEACQSLAGKPKEECEKDAKTEYKREVDTMHKHKEKHGSGME